MTTKKDKKINHDFSFATLEEEAKFCDTHSTADYEDAFKPVRVRFGKELSDMVMIRFNQRTLQKIRVRAQAKGTEPINLMRSWILERLTQKAQSYSWQARVLTATTHPQSNPERIAFGIL